MYFFFFFFQAEDGIRDHCVTGVQTCALPISPSDARHPRPDDRDGLPGPDDLSSPDADGRPPADRAHAVPPRDQCRRRPLARGGAARRCPDPRRRRSPGRLPAPVQRWDAPANRDRDRARMRSPHPDCRRAHNRAPAPRGARGHDAGVDQGRTAESPGQALGLPLSSPLHVRPAGMRNQRARPRAHRGRAKARLPGRSASGTRMKVLELRELEVEYTRPGRPPVRAVAGASLAVEAGQVVGLVGETGCGKSTLARAAVGLLKPTAGSVWFEGSQVRPIGRRARSRTDARLQMVFQNPFSSLNPRRRVGDQIADPMAILGVVPATGRRERVSELLEQVGLPAAAARRFPHQYSGGQRQRIAIARALAAEPSVIVLDEPLSSLDASAQAQVANLLQSLARELHVGLLLISHDLAIVRHIADVVAVMYLGLVVETAPTRRLWEAPLHPYTEALIEAIPRADGKGWLPEALPGEVPDPARPPAGCRVHPLCPYVFDRCRTEPPPLIPVALARHAACWLHEPGGSEPAPSTFARRARPSSGAGDQVDGI